MMPSQTQICIFLEIFDPLRQVLTKKTRNLHIPREIRPTPPILIGGRRGWRSDFVLNVRAFLALRQLPGLAEGAGTPGPACVRVCRRAMQSIFAPRLAPNEPTR